MQIKFYLLTGFLVFLNFLTVAQELPLNTELLAKVAFNENSSGMWGYVDSNGIKYAVIGTASATRVFSLENPTQPVERFVGPGAVGIWREVRYYKDHIYVSTDQGADGLVVIDMKGAPLNISYSFYKPLLTVGATTKSLERCHNIFIDEKGFCYLSGCNIGNRGVLVFDLNQNPKEPPFVGYSDIHYSHDVYVKGDTMYNSEISNGLLSIYDVKDKADIKLLTAFNTGRNFTHNAWTSADSKYVFTTDERADAYVESYDISDFNNIKLLDRFRPLRSEGTGVIPHNTYFKNGYLITSYYTDGIRIIDASKPDNLVEVGYYDTWNDPSRCHNGFFGCWGVYPLDDDDLIYGSDINNGLFIIKVNYQRACYLEGKITGSDGQSVSNAVVEIEADQLNKELSNPAGVYKTGLASSGVFKVKISHPDYFSKDTTVTLQHGVVTNLNVKLEKRILNEVVFDIKNDNDVYLNTKIRLEGSGYQYDFNQTGSAPARFNILSGNYGLFISQWGYKSSNVEEFVVDTNQPNSIQIKLPVGYEDNFENDLNWKVSSTSGIAGAWSRVIPRRTEYLNNEVANPGADAEDAGRYAYVTGNGINGAGCDDVDNGTTKLISPEMDLTSFNEPKVNYDIWFFNAGGSVPVNDTLFVKLSDGQNEVVIDKIFGSTNGWLQVRDLDISAFLVPTSKMQLIVEASDQQGNQGHIVEAGFDNFFISEKLSGVEVVNPGAAKLTLHPNPVADQLYIRLDNTKSTGNPAYTISNMLGNVFITGKADFHTLSVDVGHLPSGFYIISVDGHKSAKFMKR